MTGFKIRLFILFLIMLHAISILVEEYDHSQVSLNLIIHILYLLSSFGSSQHSWLGKC